MQGTVQGQVISSRNKVLKRRQFSGADKILHKLSERKDKFVHGQGSLKKNHFDNSNEDSFVEDVIDQISSPVKHHEIGSSNHSATKGPGFFSKESEFFYDIDAGFKASTKIEKNNTLPMDKKKQSKLNSSQNLSRRSQVIIQKKSALFTFHKKKKYYDKRSLFIFYANCFFRKAVVWLVDWKDSVTMKNQILDKAGLVFTGIFTTECVLKIIAYGLVLHENSYLRIGWNLIDFAVNSRSVAWFCKTQITKGTQSMKKLVKALISSIPDFVNVVVFLLFIFILFAILGTHQYQGMLYNRCRFVDNDEKSASLLIDQNVARVCSQSGLGMFMCPNQEYCGNPSEYGVGLEEENVTLNSQINYGIYTFDNLGESLLTVFQIITLDSWSTFMYNLMDADVPLLAALYCVTMVICGSFFLMNLILAVIIQSFIKIQQKEVDEQLLKMQNDDDDELVIEEDKQEEQEYNLDSHREENIDFKDTNKNNQEITAIDSSRKLSIFYNPDDSSKTSMLRNDKTELQNNIVLKSDPKQLFKYRNADHQHAELNQSKQQSESFKSKEHKSPDFSFLKPLSTKRKVVSIFNQVSKDKQVQEVIHEKAEEEEFPKEEEEHPDSSRPIGLSNFLEKLAQAQMKKGLSDMSINNEEKKEDGKLQKAFRNFLIKKQDEIVTRDQYFNKLLKETKDNYELQKKQSQGTTSLGQLTQIKLGMRLKRQQNDLSSQYKQFKIEGRAEKNKCYNIAYKIQLNRLFNWFIFLSIVCNTIILALDRYPIDDETVLIYDRINIGFSVVFLIDMIIKLIGLGFKGYFYDSFNTFDCIVVLTSIIDIFVSNLVESYDGGSLTALRTFRLLRIFKLAKSWQRFQELLKTMGRTLKDVSVFSILLYLFIFTYTLLGMEMFAYKAKYDQFGRLDLEKGITPNANFDGFLESTTSVFIVLTNDAWSAIYYNQYRAIGGLSTLFFFTLIIIGQKILLNLFLAILLQNFDEDSLNQAILDKFEQEQMKGVQQSKLTLLLNRITEAIQDFFNHQQPNNENLKINLSKQGGNSNNLKSRSGSGNLTNKISSSIANKTMRSSKIIDSKQIEMKKLTQTLNQIDNNQYLEGKSLFIFKQTNCLRDICFKIVTDPKFDYFIIFFIILSGVNLALENPLNDPNSTFELTLSYIDLATTIIFTLEALLKIFVFGFALNGRPSYLRNPWNLLDFAIVVLSIISLTPLSDNLKIIKVLRVIRPLRLISRNKGLKVAVKALVQAFPSIANVTIITLLFFVIFGIIGISYFKGKFQYCYQTNMTFSYGFPIHSKWDCLNGGGDWVMKDNSFDNIFRASQTLFQMATTSGWSDIMYDAVSTTEIDYVFISKNNMYWVFFFIAFIIVGGFFLLNLFVGVVISTFNREKEKIGMNNLLTDRQKEWLDSRLLVINSKPIKKLKPPQNIIRKFCFKLQDQKWFDYFILGCIILNTLVLTLKWYNQPNEVSQATEIINYIFTAIFTFEAVIKIIAMDKIYFKDGWNIFDFIIVIGSIASVFLSATTSFNLKGATTIVRAFRISRIFRLIKRAKSLRLVFNTFIVTIPALANVGSLLLLLVYLYSVLGVFLFAEVKRNGILSDHLNYESFTNAFLTLFVVATGDAWDQVMKATVKQPDITFQCISNPSYQDYINNGNQTIGCGLLIEGYLFYYSFVLLISLIFLNLFIAIILQGYEDTQIRENRLFNNDTLNHFRNIWADFDPEATTFIPISQLKNLLFALDFPLGFDKSYQGSKLLIP